MKLSNSELACAKQYFDGNPAALVSLAISGFKWKLLEHIKPKWVEISENLYQGSGDILRDMTVLKDGIDYLRSELEMECSDFDFSPTEARNAAKQLTLQMKAIVFGSVPPQLAFALRKLFQGVFRSYVVCSGGVANLDESCQGCAREQDACCCKQILECSAEIIRNLQKLELVDRLITKEAASISYSTVEKHVNETVSGSFDQAHLTELLQDGPIADWPDSMPAIQDLKKCFDLVPVNLKKEVVASLKKSVSARLLHTGVSTSVILTAYMQAVNSLRLLDPSGVIMDQVCHSIRQYLRFVSTVRVIRNTKEGSFDRQRPDTVRCIVSFLTEKNNISFGTETMTEETLFLDGNNSDREDEQGWKNWEPDPVDLCEAHGRGGHRKADMMSMLVSVYGSKELFVKEYCQLLSERLLRNFKYDAETEKRYLEMLKVRFGDSDHTLFQCEVMLKDMKDSDRLNKDINERAVHRNDNIPPVSARILSQQYWPQVREERIKLPEAAQEALDIFRKAFEDKKSGSRTIEWWPNLGRNYHKLRDTFSLSQMTCEKLEVSNFVEIELELRGQRANMVVSPMQAAIIHLFQEKESWSFDELCQRLQATHSSLKRRLIWWSSLGILGESPAGSGQWSLCSCLPPTSRLPHQSDTLEDSEEDEDEAEKTADGIEQLEQYWPYISGLLTRSVDCLNGIICILHGNFKSEEARGRRPRICQ